DPHPLPSDEKELEKRPEAENLVGIYSALADETPAQLLTEFGGAQSSRFKDALTERAVQKLGPIGNEMKRLVLETDHLDRVLADGSAGARAHAPETTQVRE